MDYTTSTNIKIFLALLAGTITVSGYFLGDVDAGFLLGAGIPIIFLAAWTRRDLRHMPTFWLLLIFWIIFDVTLLLILRPSIHVRPAVLFAPLFIVDYILVLGSFFLLERAAKRDRGKNKQ